MMMSLNLEGDDSPLPFPFVLGPKICFKTFIFGYKAADSHFVCYWKLICPYYKHGTIDNMAPDSNVSHIASCLITQK